MEIIVIKRTFSYINSISNNDCWLNCLFKFYFKAQNSTNVDLTVPTTNNAKFSSQYEILFQRAVVPVSLTPFINNIKTCWKKYIHKEGVSSLEQYIGTSNQRMIPRFNQWWSIFYWTLILVLMINISWYQLGIDLNNQGISIWKSRILL